MNSSNKYRAKKDRSTYSAIIYPELLSKKSVSPKLDDIRGPSPLGLDNVSISLDEPLKLKVRPASPNAPRLHQTRRNTLFKMFGFRNKRKVAPTKGGKTIKNKFSRKGTKK